MLLYSTWTHLGALLVLFPDDQPRAGSSSPAGWFRLAQEGPRPNAILQQTPDSITAPMALDKRDYLMYLSPTMLKSGKGEHSALAETAQHWPSRHWALLDSVIRWHQWATADPQQNERHMLWWWSYHIWDIRPAAASTIAVIAKARFSPHVSLHLPCISMCWKEKLDVIKPVEVED